MVLQAVACRTLHLLGSAMSAALTVQGSGGTQACTAGLKGLVLMSCSTSRTCHAAHRGIDPL